MHASCSGFSCQIVLGPGKLLHVTEVAVHVRVTAEEAFTCTKPWVKACIDAAGSGLLGYRGPGACSLPQVADT